MSATEPIRNKNEMRKLIDYFKKKGQIRNWTMVIVGFTTALRISDELNLKWKDVYDFEHDCFYEHVRLNEMKTRKNKQIKLNHYARNALLQLIKEQKKRGSISPDAFVFGNGRKNGNHITRMQAWRIIKAAVKALSIQGTIGCHSLRKTFGYYAWKYLKKSEAVIMDIYNHSSFDVTKRYLGITQDDLDDIYDCMVL